MVSVVKGEFTLSELMTIQCAIANRIEFGTNVDEMKDLVAIYDKVDDYIKKVFEEMDSNE